MPITYSIDHENGCVIENWTGDITRHDLAVHFRHFFSDPEVLAVARTIVDLRHCQFVLTAAELEELVRRIVMPALHGRKWRTAIVLGDTNHFEMWRQYHVFAASYSNDSVFSTTEGALAWLRSQRPA